MLRVFLILDKYVYRIWCNACPVIQYKGAVDILIDWKNDWKSLLAMCVWLFFAVFIISIEEARLKFEFSTNIFLYEMNPIEN